PWHPKKPISLQEAHHIDKINGTLRFMGNFTAVIIDFETTGLSPGYGDRTIEVGAVLVSGNQIMDRFQSLMNPDMRVSSFIEGYTGITNRMLSTAPTVGDVMGKLKSFIGQHHL